MHDPQNPKYRLNKVLESVLQTVGAKGWSAEIVHEDRAGWKYATVVVERRSIQSGFFDYPKGRFEIRVNDAGVDVSPHGYLISDGLGELHAAVMDDLLAIPWLTSGYREEPRTLDELERLLGRFHKAARALTERHASRSSLILRDEYDVQDLLGALLVAYFDDVRSEEVIPSYAGAGARTDFLLKSEQTMIETKFASKHTRDREIGDQLILDIGRYQSHPNCKLLMCLVYDPNGYLRNPNGLVSDLSKSHGDLAVRVVVSPL